MKLIERVPHCGDEIRIYELEPREAAYFNDRDNARRRWAILRWWFRKIMGDLWTFTH